MINNMIPIRISKAFATECDNMDYTFRALSTYLVTTCRENRQTYTINKIDITGGAENKYLRLFYTASTAKSTLDCQYNFKETKKELKEFFYFGGEE